MSFIETSNDYIHRFFNKKDAIILSECIDLINDTCYKELGLQKAISLLAGSFISTKIRTYREHQEIQGNLYYKLNISPNKNQNKYDFYYKFINSLIRNQEALIFEVDGEIFVADSFSPHKLALKNYWFDNVVLDDYQLKDKFFMNDVMYFTLNNEKIKGLINSINDNYSRILTALENSYVRNKFRKIIVELDTTAGFRDAEENKTQNLINDLIKPFIEGNRNVLSLPKGLKLVNLDEKANKQNDSISEMTDTGKEVLEKIAMIFNIPVDLIYGNKNELDEQEKLYMTHALKPFAEMFSSEVNRKAYSKSQILNGTYMKMDLVTTEFINLLKSADSLDKLFRIGFSNNFLRDKLGEEKSSKEWADKEYVTKNYMSVEGGEEEYEEHNEQNKTNDSK